MHFGSKYLPMHKCKYYQNVSSIYFKQQKNHCLLSVLIICLFVWGKPDKCLEDYRYCMFRITVSKDWENRGYTRQMTENMMQK